MTWFHRLRRLFQPKQREGSPSYWLHVRCDRCGETLRTRVDLQHDLSVQYGGDREERFFTRKVLIGNGPCFQAVEAELTFNDRRELVGHFVRGGELISRQ